jgi:GNAT superfamily N-acetyltransferase
MNVRRASKDDLDALLRLYVQLSEQNALTEGSRAADALEHILASPGLELLVVEGEDGVRGTLTLVVVANLTHNARPWAQVENMVVDESVRGEGFGRALIEGALQIAREAGCYKVQLQSGNQRRSAENDAHAFYKRLGFQDSSVGFRFYF